MRVLVSSKNLGLEIPNKNLFQGLDLNIQEGDCIGLVGRNGAGKSTVLKILSGALQPSEGYVDLNAPAFYLPQIDFSVFQSDLTVEEFVSKYGASWPLARAALYKWFNTKLPADQRLKTLSGGEFMKLQLAIAETKHPRLLLLDEPTNHLDVEGLEVLKNFLQSFSGAYVIVSHDPFFLNLVTNRVWELDNKTLREYGGNYTYYEEQKEIERLACEGNYEAAKKELKKAKRSWQIEQKRAARSKREGRKQAHDRSMSAIEKGYFKNRASRTAGLQEAKFDRLIREKEEKVSVLKEQRRQKVHFDLESDSNQNRRMIAKISNGSMNINGRRLIENINLTIYYGDRLVLVGKNGSGKSTLVQVLGGRKGAARTSGNFTLAEHTNIAYVDQKYNIINPSLTLYENVSQFAGDLSHEQVRQQLGRFLFFKEGEVNKKAGVLSGGEAARLTLAIVTAKPIDLLVLDEPTNNLDIETLDVIAEALVDFPGALIVISHNIHFLNRISIEKAYIISDKELKEMISSPAEPNAFYQEIVKTIKTSV